MSLTPNVRPSSRMAPSDQPPSRLPSRSASRKLLKAKSTKSSQTPHLLKTKQPSRALIQDSDHKGEKEDLSAWQLVQDPESGQYFYYNAETGETTWEDPGIG